MKIMHVFYTQNKYIQGTEQDYYNNSINILPDICNSIKNKRVLVYLDKDILGSIIVNKGVYWYQFNIYNYQYIPKYARDYFDNQLQRAGYKYLFDIC